MKIGVIGAGYIGLTTAICLSTIGHNVSIYDISLKKLNTIKIEQSNLKHAVMNRQPQHRTEALQDNN